MAWDLVADDAATTKQSVKKRHIGTRAEQLRMHLAKIVLGDLVRSRVTPVRCQRSRHSRRLDFDGIPILSQRIERCHDRIPTEIRHSHIAGERSQLRFRVIDHCPFEVLTNLGRLIPLPGFDESPLVGPHIPWGTPWIDTEDPSHVRGSNPLATFIQRFVRKSDRCDTHATPRFPASY